MTTAILHFTNGDSVSLSAPRYEKVLEGLSGAEKITFRGEKGQKIAIRSKNLNYVEEVEEE